MTDPRHCQTGYHSCAQILTLQEEIAHLKDQAKSRPNSRELAEKVFDSAKTAFADSDVEPEDVEGAIQEIEGILEREAGVRPDEALNAEREKNEREGRSL